MLKILYAGNNYTSSYHTLKRFIDTYSKYYNIKISAYSKSIKDLNVNWNLDALLDFRGKANAISFKNSNYALYIREIQRFAPDLIISDLEIYTSCAALELGIPLWQVSPLLLYYGINHKSNLYKYYSGTFSKNLNIKQYTNYIINNSDKKLILSHLGDLSDGPKLKAGYEWVRPTYELSDKNQTDNAIGLADAYFANIPTILNIDYSDPGSILTAYYNQYYGLSGKKLTIFNTSINSNVKFLSQYLEEMDI